MRLFLCLAMLAHALLLLPPPMPLVSAQNTQKRQKAKKADRVDAYAVVAEIDRIGVRASLWEGFDPRRVPLEIFNGQTTFLVRHPNPPPEFISLSSRQGVYAFRGRHESVTANAPAKLGGVWTATAMLTPDKRRALREQAALVVHEAFHVFQNERHPDWSANELELFVYPFEDTDALRLRRLETLALVRAETMRGKESAACWAASALKLRRARFARMPAGAGAYERGTELKEGLASYVEALAAGRAKRSGLHTDDYAAGEVRQRAYATGRAVALLLDRFAPDWKRRLEAGDKRSLDETLEASLPASNVVRCEITPSEVQCAASRSLLDVRALVARRETLKRDLLAQAGWKIEFVAGDNSPLFPQGFDPLNVERVGARQVIHTRYLKLGNGAGVIEIINRASLTEGAGEHPLFNGVRRMTISGLPAEPIVSESDGKTTISAADLKAEVRVAEITRSERVLHVRLK